MAKENFLFTEIYTISQPFSNYILLLLKMSKDTTTL